MATLKSLWKENFEEFYKWLLNATWERKTIIVVLVDEW